MGFIMHSYPSTELVLRGMRIKVPKKMRQVPKKVLQVPKKVLQVPERQRQNG